MKPADKWKNKEAKELCRAFTKCKTPDEVANFLRDLLTINEIQTFAQRWQVAQMLDAGKNFKEIEKKSGASSATITRVNQWLNYGMDGYRTVIKRIKK